jgi:hypothetical protein
MGFLLRIQRNSLCGNIIGDGNGGIRSPHFSKKKLHEQIRKRCSFFRFPWYIYKFMGVLHRRDLRIPSWICCIQAGILTPSRG